MIEDPLYGKHVSHVGPRHQCRGHGQRTYWKQNLQRNNRLENLKWQSGTCGQAQLYKGLEDVGFAGLQSDLSLA